MDDTYAINVAKTEFREAYNAGDANRLLAILDGGMIDYSDGRCSQFGDGAINAWRARLQELFAKYDAHLVPIIIDIRLFGDVALEYGWHELTVTPKEGGPASFTRTRYVDLWRKNRTGKWKLMVYMDNTDVPDQLSIA